MNSPHTNSVGTQLKNSMRIISGSIKPTPSYWLPILSNIPPPHFRRSNALCREFDKIRRNPLLKIHENIAHLVGHRLRSRKPPIQTAETPIANNSNLELEWEQKLHTSVPHSIHNTLQIIFWFHPTPLNMDQPKPNPYKLWSMCRLII
ncbi:hypothetical protein JTB14_024997 [Gonioctena quinquepunctata]|nr:hypothetical protein JTB14_024997 [Gonioctena quinquepunctata]